jgi:hypothetical protein
MRHGLVVLLFVLGCGSPDDEALEWVTPDDEAAVPVGDAIELAIATGHPDAAAVRFVVDGVELAVCDPTQPDEDCQREDVWRWTTVFARPGDHVVEAIVLDAAGHELMTTTRSIYVVPAVPLDEVDERMSLGERDAESTTIAAASRGVLDPDRGWHNIYGGIQWRVVGQRVQLATGTPRGTVADVRRCMNRYGASIRRWADHYRVSRASVVATALTESNCTNPSGSSDGLSSGPMQVTASTCAALTGLSRTTCRSRMHTNPDFSFKVGAKYMGSSYQRNQHRRDPPKIAAAYNAGSLRRTSANRWHMVSTGSHIDRFVRWYNAYRTWEQQ